MFGIGWWCQDVTGLRPLEEKEGRSRTVIGIQQCHSYAASVGNRNRHVKWQGTDQIMLNVQRGPYQVGSRLTTVDWTSIPA
jgi:hypothetical protein